jgi:AcrR family transcriptional regulator
MVVDAAEGSRTQAERRSKSEDSLLDAAADSIAERGIERASLAEIGERAGRSRGLASHHFGSKDALVARLAERCQDRLTAAATEAFESAQLTTPGSDGLECVRITIDTYLRHFTHPTSDERALLVMWGATFPSSSSVHGMAQADSRAHQGLRELIAAGQHDGSIAPDVDPSAAAVIILGMIRGVASQQLAETGVNSEEVHAQCTRWIISALKAPAST